jgi:C-terminal processing protease CtpA/Prc
MYGLIRRSILPFLVALTLHGCGSSGTGGDATNNGSTMTTTTSTTAGTGSQSAPWTISYTPASCTTEGQNEYIHRYMHDVYFWYGQVPTLDYASYSSTSALLEALRYGKLDKWSYITTKAEYDSYLTNGTYVGAGFGVKNDSSGTTRIAFVYRNSPADRAGLQRSDQILEANGRSAEEITAGNLWGSVFGAATAGVEVRLKIRNAAGTVRDITMQKETVTINTVYQTDILNYNGASVGYLVFQGFIGSAATDLQTAFTYFYNKRVRDVIIDLRYNGGGSVNTAQYLGYLVSGDATNGKPFTTLKFNDRYPDWNYSYSFNYETGYTPTFNRVFFITAGGTCSASELVINSMKPYLSVISAGSTTCGKPVGMIARNFCDNVLQAIEFGMYNSRGEGEYYGGLAPTCNADDDLTRQLGDTSESSLKEILYYMTNNRCSATAKTVPKRMATELPLTGFRREIGAF